MKKKYLAVLIIILNLLILSTVFADETSTFSSQKPDVLIILDGSGSMDNNPIGGTDQYGNSDCSGTTFYSGSGHAGYTTDCRKIAIAQRAIGKILDDQKQPTKQRIRMGFMGFNSCTVSVAPEARGDALNPKSGGAYNWSSGSGCNYIRNQIDDYFNSSTDNIFEAIRTKVNAFTVTGGTPLAASLAEAKKYFQDYTDNAKNCRTKFVVLISDGDDTYTCTGANGNDTQKDQYKRRRESVAAAKALYDAYAFVTGNDELKAQKIKTFVIGFGAAMPDYSEYTLNWMAYYGRTSFSSTHTGDINSYKLDMTSTTDLYPYDSTNHKITACQTSTTSPDHTNPCDGSHIGCLAADIKTDPGRNQLTGYAFMASNATELDTALVSAFTVIEATYSFATSSVQSVRTKDENYIYEASFGVRQNDPLYVGHLKQYKINDDGTIPTNYTWDAGAILRAATSRNIQTISSSSSGSLTAFTTANVTSTDLGVADATAAGKVITFIRDGDTTTVTDPENAWKLGDTFHSFPVAIGTPATYFCDNVDSTTGACCDNIFCDASCGDTCTSCGTCCTCAKAFDVFRGNHIRATDHRNHDRMIVTGANDGQLHMFSTYDGAETWSFIPPNLLSQLQYISHQTHPDTGQVHTFFVDGPISVSDIWLPGSTIGVTKSYNDWRTWMVFSEGRGAKNTLWSKSTSTPCVSGLSPYYSTTVGGVTTTYPYYCGYYAFDMTDVTRSSPAPAFKWFMNIPGADAPYLAEPWSKMVMSRVRINGNEKWVGFFGGGYSACTTADNPNCAYSGKGFFIVDVKTGGTEVWQRFSSASNLTMSYQLPATPAAVDTDSDGFVDTVYLGDLGNNIWRFKLCLAADDTASTKCGMGTTGRWITTALLSSTNNNRKIYTQAAVTRDTAGNMWVYVGTGDKMNPTATGMTYKDRLYAIIDNDLSSTWSAGNLFNATSANFDPSTIYNPLTGTGYHGWYMDLSIGDGEKMLADPVVFQGVVYFTTYVPPSGTDVCHQSGSAYLYAIDYITGAGRLEGGAKYEFIGYGIASSPIVSMNPYGGTDIYVSESQKNTQTPDTFVHKVTTPDIANYNKTNLMMWRDQRVQ